jgi:Domain of unknown function (DUF4450)
VISLPNPEFLVILQFSGIFPMFDNMKFIISIAVLPMLLFCAIADAQEGPQTKMHPMLTNNIARPLRYWPANGDFVITNGSEFFNRPLYCDNLAFRIDCGDKPEFSIYTSGRGGNLRPGIKTRYGIKWLNDADEIVTRYRPGSMIYEIRDPHLTDSGRLTLTVLPLSDAKGAIVQAALKGSPTPIQLVLAFGGANGMRGRRGGDIGCENKPISQFFQLQPDECKGNEISVNSNTFVLKGKAATITGIFPAGSQLQTSDAVNWSNTEVLFAATNSNPQFPVATAKFDLLNGKPVYFALQETGESPKEMNQLELAAIFSAAEDHRSKIAGQVIVETPDAFINAAVPALNIAANAIWDEPQQSFMHGAVAWRVRLAGWRGPYAGDALGWHERTAEHFASFAREQNTNPIPDTLPPADEEFNLARNETALHSNGDMTKSHYDMNLVLVDAFFRHLLWTGDTNYAAQMWPVIERHLAWERRLFRREFGSDKLPLYEGYAAIWASDDLSYNGGGAAHASAYNYFENKMAARVAKILGKDPASYEHEVDLILRGMNEYLWLEDEACFAEYKDYLGLQPAHGDPALWTFYTTIDSEAAAPVQAWEMSKWVDNHIARFPIDGANVPNEGLFTLPTSNWMPYEWSLNNAVMAEAAHTSLAYWEANRPETAFKLFKGELLQSMYLGLCPGNLGAMTSFDAARGESQRDFGDAIGINSRALVEGLFGVKPDALAGELRIVPGFPANWNFAKISHPDFNFDFHRTGGSETFVVESKFPKPIKLLLDIPVPGLISSVTVNDSREPWKQIEGTYGVPRVEIESAPAARWKVHVEWTGRGPDLISILPSQKETKENTNEMFDWNHKYPTDEKFEVVNLTAFFNDDVKHIFENEYRAPRSPFCSLATPKQGIGGWCEPDLTFEVDDSGLRRLAAENNGKIILPDGMPFETPGQAAAKNIIFTSQWHNYPTEVSVPLTRKSSRAFLLMAGSSNPMQSWIDNGEVVVAYTDGTEARLPLKNPTTWWPIDQDYFTDDYAFRLESPLPPRVDLKTGRIRILNAAAFKGKGGKIPGGAATVLELPLDAKKKLKSLTVRALANEVVIGLMGVTLERE